MHHPYRFVLLLSFAFAACGTSVQIRASDAGANENAAHPAASGAAQLTLDELRTFTDVFNQVRRSYVEPVDDRTLLRSAIEGMLADLDPHSAYLPQEDYADLENSSRGRYVGLGFDVRPENGRLVVKQVISPSPADDAGINPGDIILAVDDVPIRGRPLQESIDAISGPEGSPVRLTLLRADGERLELELRRAFVKVPAMDFRLLDGHFGYFHLAFFHRDSATDLKNSIDSVRGDGIDLKGLILDLRNNPGGVLQPAIEIADGFLDSGTIVVTRGRDPSDEVSHAATPGQWLPGIPVVILVDRGSASASEVLAGALQDHGRALIIGERTFGKGSVQSVLSLRNGAGLKLTTARYYTPSGRSIQAEGIRPDQVAAAQMLVADIPDERNREADLERHLASDGKPADNLFDTEAVNPEEDYPLFQAVSVLRGARILSSAARGAPPAEQ